MASQIIKNHISAIRENYKMYLRMNGEEVSFIRRKESGERCSCFDKIRMSPEPDCSICRGTGLVTGYEIPFKDFIGRVSDPDVSFTNITPIGERESLMEITIWKVADPLLLIKAGDIISRGNKNLYEVIRTDVTDNALFDVAMVVKQNIVAIEISPEDSLHRHIEVIL